MAPNRMLGRHRQRGPSAIRSEHSQLDLSWKTCEPRVNARRHRTVRGADALANAPGGAPAALSAPGRRLGPRPAYPRSQAVIVGDFNEWGRKNRSLARASRASISTRTSATPHLPGFFPVLHPIIYFDR
jgi:hypothetical protein